MSKIRECFTSRFDNGHLIEVDYSQLEVAVLAFLSQDTNLITDINTQLDMHLVSLSWVTGRDYNDLKDRYDDGDLVVATLRKAAKRPRFELQYGAGAHTIAKNNGWPLGKAKDYIAKYYERYPDVKRWQDRVAAIVAGNAKIQTGWITGTSPQKISHYTCPHTNRRYVFKSFPNKRGEHTFSPTQLKNYPVQGFATADLVPTVLGKIVNKIYEEALDKEILICNTVHDSILFDTNNLGKAVQFIDRLFDSTHDIMVEQFNCHMNVDLRYTISTGSNWGSLKEFFLI